MNEYESVLIERCVRTRFDFLSMDERARICALSKELALKKDSCKDFPDYEKRRRIICEAVKKYGKENCGIVPSGFVDFRLRELYYYVEAMVECGADMFFKEKEYEEFTYLLRTFIEEKESREEVLHLLWVDGDVRLLNKRGRDVTVKYEKEFYHAAQKKGIGREDLAISAIISAAPEKLIMHSPPETSPLKEALEKIFEGRYKICTGCNICKNS